MFALFNEERLRRILARMLDEQEFLGPHGIRAISRWHAEHPYVLNLDGQDYSVGYLPAESDTGMFGGNSNWRGPVWAPINLMLIRGLLNLHEYYGDTFTVECPTGSGQQMNLYQVANEISERLVSTFRRDADGRRPIHGGQPILQTDPHWRDLLLFYEYIHGDNGAGIGASHQTGWTGTIGVLPLLFRGHDRQRDPRGRHPGSPHRGKRGPGSRANGGGTMTGWPDKPVIYEVNTAVWLAELTRAAGAPVTLGSVTDSGWDAITPAGADAVWLMGVWERSPAGLELARANAGLLESFREALPDLRTRTSSDRRTACTATWPTSGSAARPGWPRRARRSPPVACG